jgi:hypothetical protein
LIDPKHVFGSVPQSNTAWLWWAGGGAGVVLVGIVAWAWYRRFHSSRANRTSQPNGGTGS